MYLKSTSISKYLGKEELGTEKGVNFVSSGDQTKKKIVRRMLFMRGLLLQVSSDKADRGLQEFGEVWWSALDAGSWLC